MALVAVSPPPPPSQEGNCGKLGHFQLRRFFNHPGSLNDGHSQLVSVVTQPGALNNFGQSQAVSVVNQSGAANSSGQLQANNPVTHSGTVILADAIAAFSMAHLNQSPTVLSRPFAKVIFCTPAVALYSHVHKPHKTPVFPTRALTS